MVEIPVKHCSLYNKLLFYFCGNFLGVCMTILFQILYTFLGSDGKRGQVGQAFQNQGGNLSPIPLLDGRHLSHKIPLYPATRLIDILCFGWVYTSLNFPFWRWCNLGQSLLTYSSYDVHFHRHPYQMIQSFLHH